MIGTRYEDYSNLNSDTPFVLHRNLEKTHYNYSKQKNWHEDLELQLCRGGHGTALLNGEKYEINKDDIVVVNSNVIHYISTDDKIIYTCLIIKASFCKQVGIDYEKITFSPFINSPRLIELFDELQKDRKTEPSPYQTAQLCSIVLQILIELAKNHTVDGDGVEYEKNKSFENIKSTIKYVRKNYNRKLSLDEIAQAIYADKYALCRDFKRLVGQTIVQYTNTYRCQIAAELIATGGSVAEAAEKCGFENTSFFIKTFKKYMGTLPSSYKKH